MLSLGRRINRITGHGMFESSKPPLRSLTNRPSGTRAVPGATAVFLMLSFSLSAGGVVAADHESPGDDGFVTSLAGCWRVVVPDEKTPDPCCDDQRIVVGQLVPPDRLYQSCDRGSDDFLEIARWDSSVDKLTCAGLACNTPQPLPHVEYEPASFLSRLGSAASRLLSGQPTRYVTTAARGVNLREAVIVIDDQSIDPGPAFQGAPQGSYRVMLRSLSNAALATTGEYSVTADGSADSTAFDLPAGLYLMRAISDTGRSDAWVLVQPRETVDAVRAQFRSLEQLSLEWQESSGLDESTRRSLLRAALDALSRQ